MSALGWHSSRQSDAHQLRRQSLQCSWTSSLELPADGPQTAGLVRKPTQTEAEDDLAVPRTKTSTYGPRSFVVSRQTSWNSLPQSFRDATPTLGQLFQRWLKTSLFRLTDGRHLTALHSRLSGLLERRTTNVRTELNWTERSHTLAACSATSTHSLTSVVDTVRNLYTMYRSTMAPTRHVHTTAGLLPLLVRPDGTVFQTLAVLRMSLRPFSGA